MNYKHSDLTGQIIAAFYDVYNTLGSGFLEKVYENALAHELQKRGHRVRQQIPIDVFYDGVNVGHYVADLIVDDLVIVEMKAIENITSAHEAQLLNYLRATGIEVGLLLNCGPRPQVRRKIYETARHKSKK
ncbi:MAG: GxxExxY protein [Gammaproteobacteria bacterium]|nr:MAG: GxxExxY protein [Gammaproteobacteria bacterium]